MKRTVASLALLARPLAPGCGGGGGPPWSPPSPPSTSVAAVNLLFMGNSHTSVNDLPGMVEAMVRAARPGKTVAHVEAPGWMFLQERSQDPATLQLLRERNWSYVV